MFVSYAQNLEDVILMRALRTVERGAYVDVGANDPVVDSVSLAFYELGWRGIHVEPVPMYAERLRAARPEEEVIQGIVSTANGEQPFYQIGDTGLSTSEREIAEKHIADGRPVERLDVRSVPLSAILDRFTGRDLHWLKIDVEGAEKDVLESWGQSAVRPWIVVVEAVEPGVPVPAHETWEPLLLERGYAFVYFDGINRFYVAQEQSHLKDAFGPGPNLFDDFVLSGTANSPFAHKLLIDAHNERFELNAQLNAERQQNEARGAAIERQTAEWHDLARNVASLNETIAKQQATAETQSRQLDGAAVHLKAVEHEVGRLLQKLDILARKYVTDAARLAELLALTAQVNTVYDTIRTELERPSNSETS